MKHVFLIHSHICYFMAISIIDKNNISKLDVLFLTSRNYKPLYSDIKTINIDNITNNTSKLNIYKIINIDKQIKKIDKILKDCKCNSFYAYVPHMSILISQILVSNKNCVNFAYIEEGLAYYVKRNYSEHFLKFPSYLKTLFRIYNYLNKRIELGHSAFGAFKSFKNPIYYLIKSEFAPNNKNVKLIELTYPKFSNINYTNIDNILILGAHYEYNLISSTYALKKCYEKIIDSMNINSTIYVKKHPSTSEKTLQLINEIVNKKKLQLTYITSPVELIMMTKKALNENISIGSIDSSLLFYSNILYPKAKIYIGFRFLMNIDKIYRTRSSMKSIEYLFDNKFLFI